MIFGRNCNSQILFKSLGLLGLILFFLRNPGVMIEPEASLVAPVQPVDHVLDALDVAPVGESGAVGGAAGGHWGRGGRRLLRLHAACRTARQPGGGRVESKISKSGVG